MRPATVTVTGVAASAIIPLDFGCPSPSKGVYVSISATATYTVQVTPDDIQNPAVTPTWYPVPVAALVGATANQAQEVTIPARAIRLNVTASTGTATMTVVQQSLL